MQRAAETPACAFSEVTCSRVSKTFLRNPSVKGALPLPHHALDTGQFCFLVKIQSPFLCSEIAYFDHLQMLPGYRGFKKEHRQNLTAKIMSKSNPVHL